MARLSPTDYKTLLRIFSYMDVNQRKKRMGKQKLIEEENAVGQRTD